ncbi:MAG: hypothetical protein KC431_27565, partial [Myxococcales bacterium]|nr:hypothetical protein [Myxococcales bacterium]
PRYEDFRVEDRRSLRSLQQRIIDWIRGDRDEVDGWQIFADLQAFASLALTVSRRPVLCEHDRAVLELLLCALEMPGADQVAVYRLLETIRGRDQEIDDLIEGQVDLLPSLWLEPTRRVLAGLAV